MTLDRVDVPDGMGDAIGEEALTTGPAKAPFVFFEKVLDTLVSWSIRAVSDVDAKAVGLPSPRQLITVGEFRRLRLSHAF